MLVPLGPVQNGSSLVIAGMDVNDDPDKACFGAFEGEPDQGEPQVDMGPGELAEARQGELKYIDSMYEEVSVDTCWADTGKPPIGTRWVDVVKTSDGETLIRSRLVARDVLEKGDKREDLFAATGLVVQG